MSAARAAPDVLRLGMLLINVLNNTVCLAVAGRDIGEFDLYYVYLM
jgi:hypothetical protein